MLYRYGESHNHKRKIEETWKIEEVDFNICGLSMDCFLPPSDLIKRDNNNNIGNNATNNNVANDCGSPSGAQAQVVGES